MQNLVILSNKLRCFPANRVLTNKSLQGELLAGHQVNKLQTTKSSFERSRGVPVINSEFGNGFVRQVIDVETTIINKNFQT